MGEYGLEIRGIANATGIRVVDMLVYNIAYELEGGCTSIVAQDDHGHLIHGRNLDFGLFLGEDWKHLQWTLTEESHYNHTVYNSTVFLGYVGTLTAVKHSAFSVSVNTRYDKSDWAALRAFLEGKGSGNFLSLLLRDVMVSNHSFAEALATVRSAKILGPAYVILGGTQAGEDPFYDNRRSPAEHCLRERFNDHIDFKGMFSVLAAHPNRNRLTTYTALMSAQSGDFEAYLQFCTDPLCAPWMSQLMIDFREVRELTLTVEKLTVENANRRKELDDLITDTQAKQMELDKTAELFRQLHDDRKKIIEQWEESVKSMKSRDSQLERLGEEITSSARANKYACCSSICQERRQFHEDIEGENEKMEQTIQQTAVILEAKTSLTGFKDEVEVMKNQLNACISEKLNTQNQHEVGAKRLEQRKEKHDQAYKSLDGHKKALQEHQQTRRSKEQMSQDAEKARQDMLNNMKLGLQGKI
eukprot:g6591.t1